MLTLLGCKLVRALAGEVGTSADVQDSNADAYLLIGPVRGGREFILLGLPAAGGSSCAAFGVALGTDAVRTSACFLLQAGLSC